MRILYIGDYQGPDLVATRRIGANRHTGGTAKISRIAKALASQSHEVHIVSSGFPGNRSGDRFSAFDGVVEGTAIPVWYAPAVDIPRIGSNVFAFHLKRWLRKRLDEGLKWDVAIIYNLDVAQTAIAAYLARSFSIPIVVEYEDSALISIGGRSWYARQRGLRRIDRLSAAIRGAIVVCEDLAHQLPTENVLVLQGMLDYPSTLPPRARNRTERPRILYAGGLTSLKGPDLLLDALEMVRTPCDVAIVGTGPLLEQLAARATTIQRHSCTVYGELNTERYQEMLAGADVCVNPHRMGLGHQGTLFPFKIIEYIGAGKPVVTSPLSALPKGLDAAVVKYESDSAAELAAAIESAILQLPSLRPLAAAAAARAFESYSIPAVAGRLTEILERAIRTPCPA